MRDDAAVPSIVMIQPVIERVEGLRATDFPELIRRAPDAFSQLFASLASGGGPGEPGGVADNVNARWSILMSSAQAELRLSTAGGLRFRRAPDGVAPTDFACDGDFLTAFGHWVSTVPSVSAPTEVDLPFVGGWSFYLSYELAGQIEPTLALPAFSPAVESGFPIAVAQYHPAALVFDHRDAQMYLVHDDRSPACVDAVRKAIRAFRDAEVPSVPAFLPGDAGLSVAGLIADDPLTYERGVSRILDYLQAGDVFQANLSRAWRFATVQADAGWRIFQRLGRHNPAPFAAWYRLPEGQIISSSPERLVDHVDGRVSTRPIAGTRRRDTDPERDRALMAELRAHPKERAEHVMLIDLERNDLGRVCQPGSVRVDELMTIESFAHVHHLVSNVSGRLRADRSVFDLLAAVFPGGTITGCPKVRCMEILAELEATGRGPYTGSVGYLGLHGQMDSNILIRTVFLGADGAGEFRAGAGIVADSQPERERIETEEKARGLLLALGARPA